MVFQQFNLFPHLTVAENVMFGLELDDTWLLQKWLTWPFYYNKHRIYRERAMDYLRTVKLDEHADKYPAQISGGMKKRAGLARALSLDPKILFYDEPSAGLDPVSAVELDDLLLTLNESLGVTIVLVTHELASIFKIGKRCVMLDKAAQGIIAQGDPRELRDKSTDPTVRRFFNREPRAN